MKAKKTVSDIMTKQVITLCINDELVQAEALFKKHKIHHIPVVEGKHIVGMLSWNDLLRVSFADSVGAGGDVLDEEVYKLFKINNIMTSRVTKVSADKSVKKVAKLFVKKGFHALPVVKEDDELVGIVTTTDIIKYYLKK